MIEFLKRTFTDDHYRGSLRLGPFYLIKGKRIPWPERFSSDSSEAQRARGITEADIAEARELKELDGQVGADANFAAILESRRQTRKTYHAALKAQNNRLARFGKKVAGLAAISGDEETARIDALKQMRYTLPTTPETRKSPAAEIISDLRGAAVLGTDPAESDIETYDLPKFLNKLT